MGSRCPKCNREIGPEEAFCPHDGAPLDTDMMDPLLGIALSGRYLLRERIGIRGRFVLYSGEDEETGRPVLVTARASGLPDDRLIDSFRTLARQVSDLDHVRCTRIRDYGRTTEGVLFVVEDGERFQPLDRWLQQRGHLPTSMAFDLINQLLDGLDHLHAKGLAHGSLGADRLRLAIGDDDLPRLRMSLADIPCSAADAVDAARSSTVVDDFRAAVRLLILLIGGTIDDGGARIPVERMGLDRGSVEQLQAIIDRELGDKGPGFDSAWDLKHELEQLSGQSRFGRYSLLQSIGAGGMGEIYLARAEGLEGVDINRLCVIKTIRTALADDQKFVERFLSEARVLASLSHGNIVPVYDVGKVGRTFYIAMAHVAGKDLKDILNRATGLRRRIPVPLALFIARELANGLAYAHRAKVQGAVRLVHRDVSPHNVLVSYEGEVKLIDFGLVHGARGGPESQDGIVMGKICYLSPEQAQAQPLDQRTDIYSAGLVLFEMLTGEPFFNQESVQEVMANVTCPVPHPPSDRVQGIPGAVDRICLCAMAPTRDERYDSAANLRDDLAAALARIAPRTNPEEVGAFVRELFPDEQERQGRYLSDLSITLPPSALAIEDHGSERGTGEDSASMAYSLLGVSPTRVHLASTIAAPLGTLDDLVAPVRSPRGTVTRPGAVGSEIVERPAWSPPPPGTRHGLRWPLMTMVGMVLLGVGIALGLWIFRRDPPKVVLVKPTQRPEVQSRTFELKEHELAATDEAARAPSSPDRPAGAVVPRRSRKGSAKGNGPGPRSCKLMVLGGPSGATVRIDGRVRGQLPLERPLELKAMVMHRIEVRRGQLLPYRRSLSCRAGEMLSLRLEVR